MPSYESLQSQTFLMLAGKEQRGSPRIALGVKILRALPDLGTCNFLLQWYAEKCHECAYPKQAVTAIANSVWSTFGQHLKEPRYAGDLEHVSTVLCKNAERALEEFEDYDKWLESISGTNLRWETLGSVFGALTTAVLSLPDRDAFFATQRGDRRIRRSFSVEMKDCVQACITLSNYMDLINVPMVSLLVKNLILQTVISGDASKCYKKRKPYYSDLCYRFGRLETAWRSRKCFHCSRPSPPSRHRKNDVFHCRDKEAPHHCYYEHR
jgi:hypothetical protein